MSILDIVTRNFGIGSRTKKPTDMVEYPKAFRGALVHDPALCVGCKTCAYVCSPTAITFDTTPVDFVAWEYSSGQCTFCGRCVEYCPCHALRFHESAPPLAATRAQQVTRHAVYYQHCLRCERPVIPLPLPVLIRLYPNGLDEQTVQDQKLCEECRREMAGRRLKEAFEGMRKE